MSDYPTGTSGAVHPGSDEGRRVAKGGRAKYAVSLAILSAVVLSAVVDGATEADVWGPSDDRVSAAAGGYELEVRYPTVSRPALATPFDIVVRRAEGFDGPIDIAIDPRWVAMWDYQSLYPEPSSSTGDPEQLVWTFDPPDGDVLRVFFDARIQPAEQSGRDGWVAVLDPSGERVVEVDFTTAVRP